MILLLVGVLRIVMEERDKAWGMNEACWINWVQDLLPPLIIACISSKSTCHTVRDSAERICHISCPLHATVCLATSEFWWNSRVSYCAIQGLVLPVCARRRRRPAISRECMNFGFSLGLTRVVTIVMILLSRTIRSVRPLCFVARDRAELSEVAWSKSYYNPCWEML